MADLFPEKTHVCDTGNFDRTVCPEPCGMMHSFCAKCGARQDRCAHERATPTTEISQLPCSSCGATPTYTITLRGKPVPACLRHLNHWRTPASDYTCPTRCVEVNHPRQEHDDWLNSLPEVDQ